MRRLEMPPAGLVIEQSDRAYHNPRGPFDERYCVACGRRIFDGSACVGIRIDNPTLLLQCLGGPPENRNDGCHFNVHIGVACLKQAMAAGKETR